MIPAEQMSPLGLICRKALAGIPLSADEHAAILAIPTPPAPATHIKLLVVICEHESYVPQFGAPRYHRSKVAILSKSNSPLIKEEKPCWINTTDLIAAGLPISRDHSRYEAVLSIRPLAAGEKFDFAFNTPPS